MTMSLCSSLRLHFRSQHFDGQLIEQFGVRGLLALRAEVFQRGDEAPAEIAAARPS